MISLRLIHLLDAKRKSDTDLLFLITLLSEYVKRVIVHPAFKNISFKEAERMLAEMDQGECVVRPSSKVRRKAWFCIENCANR